MCPPCRPLSHYRIHFLTVSINISGERRPGGFPDTSAAESGWEYTLDQYMVQHHNIDSIAFCNFKFVDRDTGERLTVIYRASPGGEDFIMVRSSLHSIEATPELLWRVKMVASSVIHYLISEMGPEGWSRYMFGNVRITSPEGRVFGTRLEEYIIRLNDSTEMTREQIADKIDELMGDDVPKITMFPASWIMEERPVRIVTDE